MTLGLDSLDYTRPDAQIGQMEDVDIPAEAMVEFETVDDVLRWLESASLRLTFQTRALVFVDRGRDMAAVLVELAGHWKKSRADPGRLRLGCVSGLRGIAGHHGKEWLRNW